MALERRPLAGKVALVTGGSRGIGRAIVERLSAAGADVVFGYHSSASAARQLEQAAGCVGVCADLESDNTPRFLVDQTVERFGRLDILIVSAARWQHSLLLETPIEVFDRMHRVNTRATFLLLQHAGSEMARARNGGRIVVLTSRAARRPRPGTSAYSATKVASVSLVKSAALELADYGVTVNELSPGPIATEMNHDLRSDTERGRELLALIPLRRFGEPDDLAAAVLFLVSDAASFVTGSHLAVDGGASVT
jgi:3-oxoacyl-[acyl-carrier protein] reductase